MDIPTAIKAHVQSNLSVEKEDTHIYGLDTYSLIYMIGELYRRTGDYHNAILWLGKVITGPGAGPKIKDKARDMRDLAREMEIESVKLQAQNFSLDV